jgi:signal peptidase I
MVLGVALLGVLAAGAIATGRAVLVTTHGLSMKPVYHQGDLVVVAGSGPYHVGQIVAYRLPVKQMVVVHRIIGGDAAGFVMKGDNNQSIDPHHPAATQIIGRAALRVPQGGLWLARLTDPVTLALVTFMLTAGGGTAVQARRRRKRAAMSRHASRRPRAARTVFPLPRPLQAVAGPLAAISVAGLAVGALAWSSPLEEVVSSSAPSARQLNFAYSAAVGRTPAYDGSIVRSPDPVFRRLSNTVDVHLAYQGRSGSVTVSADLATPGGWHSTVPLAPATTFTGSRYESTVRLDLRMFDARAQSAAAVTGLPAGPLSVAVVARVRTAGDAPFSPTLNLNLTPLQLSMVSDATNLIVHDPATVARTTRMSHSWTVLGGHLTVAHARVLSPILLLAALFATTVLGFIARHAAPASEGAGIRRRYAPLLASVRPITTPANFGLIEVTEFVTLARLAERCGLLVLHWSRSGVDTFIVLNEGTAYRYRSGSDLGPGSKASTTLASPGPDHRDHSQLEPTMTEIDAALPTNSLGSPGMAGTLL